LSFPTLIDKTIKTIKKHSMLSGKETVVIGLSGGPDSVCLLHVLNYLKDMFMLNLHALYIDHGLRVKETPAEIDFCRRLCENLTVPFIKKTINVNTYVKEQKLNKQEAARELRYITFEETANEINAHKIALGHTADDQAETLLMRLLRGSGLTGLSGIPPVRKNIIRPLIEIGREEIEQFLDKEKIEFIIDSSNLRETYLRNKIRRSILPILKELNPGIIETLSNTALIFRDEERYFDIIVKKILVEITKMKTDETIKLSLTPLEVMDKVLIRRVLRGAIDETKGLRGISFLHIEDIIELIKNGQSGDRLYLPKGLRVIKEYELLTLTSEITQRLNSYTLMVPGEVFLKESKAVLRASLSNAVDNYGDGKNSLVFDADKTENLLTIRARENGDSFYPSGFGKRKKLQDFFVDEKITRDERDSIPIVVSGNDIVWVAGFRGDERFIVSQGTKRFLKLELKKTL
jgi:tRNA(Ile)-lysidine synthase